MAARRNNYKTKWLASLADHASTAGTLVQELEGKLDTVDHTQFSATRELVKVHEALIECGKTATDLCDLMDETRICGDISFKTITHPIDGKLSTMPSKVLVTRVKDVLRIADERIGLLSSICESYHDAMTRVNMKVCSLEVSNRKLQGTVLKSLVIGQNPTVSELEDYSEDPLKVKRLSEYNELSDEFTSVLTNIRRQEMDYDVGNHLSESDHDDLFNDGDDPHETTGVVATYTRTRAPPPPRNVPL